MDYKLLPKGFFKNNILKNISTAYITYYLLDNEDYVEKMINTQYAHLYESDSGKIEEERAAISRLKTGDEVTKFMRKKFSSFNNKYFAERVLEIEDQVLPDIIKRFRTSLMDEYIETAINVFYKADIRYINELKSMYYDIRSPYAQSLLCLIFGIRKLENIVPFLLKEYERLKNDYPNESFSEGPLLAIYILYGKA